MHSHWCLVESNSCRKFKHFLNCLSFIIHIARSENVSVSSHDVALLQRAVCCHKAAWQETSRIHDEAKCVVVERCDRGLTSWLGWRSWLKILTSPFLRFHWHVLLSLMCIRIQHGKRMADACGLVPVQLGSTLRYLCLFTSPICECVL